jgi:peptidoglycan biosynthesis protein MviN/MurJ (putative lipid II flippase)
VITAGAALLLYEPYGVGGIVAATGIATIASVVAQAWVLRGELGRLELGRLLSSGMRILAAAGALAAVAYGVWDLLDGELGRGTGAQIVSLGLALGAGALVYLAAVVALRVPEADQALRVIRRS